MPKILENLKELLLLEARKQIKENGYSALTVRSVADACHIGVGTLYNYFPSKDVLVASVILEDWQKTLKQIEGKIGASAADSRVVLHVIYTALNQFMDDHQTIFSEERAVQAFSGAFFEKHSLLRSQLTTFIKPFCGTNNLFMSEFIAEALLTWTVAGKSFEEIYAMIAPILAP
jgi:AcrR family transcriptional regulator